MRPYLLIHEYILRTHAKSGFILANSKFTLDSYIKYGCKGAVVYYPCNIKGFHPSPNKKNIVISVGRISPERAHEVTLEIASLVPETRFILLGRIENKKYYCKLLKLAPPNVKILPNPKRAEIIKFLSIGKVYINSRFMETFGVAVVEGMASGCVPVVRDHGAVKETVTDEVGFRWKTIEEAADYIRALLNNERLFREMSLKAMERAREFTPEKFEGRVATTLATLLR